jgi:hypothetical protein
MSQFLVTKHDESTHGVDPGVDDVPNMRGWAQRHSVPLPDPPAATGPDPNAERDAMTGVLGRRAATGRAGPGMDYVSELMPPFVSITSRTHLLGLTLVCGFTGLMIYSFFSGKPLIE